MEDAIDVTTSLSSDTANLPPIPPALLEIIKSITSKLPIYSFRLLQLLCRHLKKVADNEQENRMSVSNLALIFIPTLNIGRALFHCMVEHYHEIFEGSNAAPMKKGSNPPPLPQKPRNLSVDLHQAPPPPVARKKVFHSKTMSDTDLIINALPTSPSPPTATQTLTRSKSNKIPPPKPSRSPLTNPTSTPPPPPPPSKPPKHNQQDYISGNSSPTLPSSRPKIVPMKPRSKSVSSPVYNRLHLTSSSSSSHSNNYGEESEDTLWRTRSGRVEAIGRQFETLMNNKN